jgi:5'-nucleotidase
LTNDDGIHAPGLAAMEHELRKIGHVNVVAPATEQSGVGHSITYLSPLVCQEIFDGSQHRGWAVEGSPADCVKIGVFEFCEERPDLVVSGINGGLNAGINVLYSGTVAAAIEGAFFGITSVAVSLEYDEHANFAKAARIARGIIERLLQYDGAKTNLFNLNIPTAAVSTDHAELKIVPMGVSQYGTDFIRRKDPKGRPYYWATLDPPPPPTDDESDLLALREGHITLTPLEYDMTKRSMLNLMKEWRLSSSGS